MSFLDLNVSLQCYGGGKFAMAGHLKSDSQTFAQMSKSITDVAFTAFRYAIDYMML